MIIKARSKPVVVEALQWNFDVEELHSFVPVDLINFTEIEYRPGKPEVTLQIFNTLEKQWINCPRLHYIIKDLKGEFYPCDPTVFEQKYNVL